MRMGWRYGANILLELLLALQAAMGRLSKKYDPAARRMTENLSQTFSHVALVTVMTALARE